MNDKMRKALADFEEHLKNVSKEEFADKFARAKANSSEKGVKIEEFLTHGKIFDSNLVVKVFDLRLLDINIGKKFLDNGQGLQVETTHIDINQSDNSKDTFPCKENVKMQSLAEAA